MQSPLRDVTQPSPAAIPRQLAAHPSGSETTVSGKATTAAKQPLRLPEDVVTLSSSSRDGASPKRKASQPVSSEEREALLKLNSLRGSFSVYG